VGDGEENGKSQKKGGSTGGLWEKRESGALNVKKPKPGGKKSPTGLLGRAKKWWDNQQST